MKVCPECDRTYHDEQQNFCLMDGAVLIDGASQPTVAISSGGAETAVMSARATRLDEPQEKKRSGLLLPVALAGLALIVGVAIGGAALYFYLNRQNVGTKSGNKADDKPVRASRPTPNKTPDAPNSTPPSKGDNNLNKRLDDPTDAIPVLWMTTGVPFEDDTSDFTTIACPPDGSAFAVWGVDFYTSDSSICTAAVHAGLISFESGGKVKVEFITGRSSHDGSERNGVASLPYGKTETSFVFVQR